MDFTAQSLTKARDAGYTDDEIWGFLSEQNKGFSGARDAGYSLDETMDYVSKNPSIFAPQGTSFTKEIQQMGAGFMESLGRPLESIGETAEVFGFTDIAEGLKGAITEPENYESASARFAEPKEGDASFLGFAWQYAPRAIVEQTGQLLGSMATRGAGAIAGAPLGPGGVAAGAFVGPAVFEAAQIIGPVAKERAANNGREVPNQEDIAGAILTATGSGALNAIGARYLPGGEKATGKFFKRLATSFLGEGTTETGSAFVEQIGGTAFTEKGLEVSPKQALAEGIIGGGSSATITTIAAPLHREPKEKKIVTEEEAEEQDIEGKSNIEAINLTAPAGDIQTKKDVSRIGELEKVKAENELLSQALEPNEPEAKRLDLENAAIDKEIKRLQGSVIEGAGLTPITKAEEEAVAASKEETPASISAKVEQIKVNMAGLDPTSRRYAQLQEELSTEEGKLVSQQQAELAKAIAEEPVAPEVAPTEEVAPVEPTAPTEVAPPTAQVEPVSEPITPVVSEEGVQVSDITTAPVTEQAEAPTITEPTTPEAPAPEAMQMAFDDANPNIVTNQEDLINTFTPQEKAEYTELEDLRYKSAAMQGPEKGYKPFKLTKKQKDRRVELEQKFRDREQKAGAASQVRFDVTASRPVKASLVENFNITLPEGYTKQGDLYVYQPTPAVSETITEPAAAPAGPAVGNRIRLGRSPQAYVIEEVIPQTDREKELGEQYYSVKNERTGEVETVEAKDLKLVKAKGARKMAAVSETITPRTQEEQAAFDKASSNKVIARNPQLAIAAVRLKNREITVDEYADLIDKLDPFKVKGAEPIPNKEKIQQYISSDKRDQVMLPIQSGKEVEFRIDIPTYNRSTAAGDTVYAVTAHEPVPETSNRVGKPISYIGIAKVINPKMMTRAISGKGDAIDIATGAGKFPLATVKGNYEAITELPTDINDSSVWTEVSYNPIRSSQFIDVRSKNAVVGGDEAIMVGSRVFVKNPTMEARPTGLIGKDLRYMADIRVTEEVVKPVPKDRQYSFEDIEKRVKKYFGGTIPEDVVIVNDTTEDYQFKGAYIVDNGQLIINQAYIDRKESIFEIISHELGHFMYGDPEFQAAFKNFWNALTSEERAEIDRIINEFYNKDTGEVQLEERRVMAFEQLIENSKARSAWRKFLDAIGNWINKTFGTNIKTTDAGAMAVLAAGHKRFKSGEKIVREMESGAMRMAARPKDAEVNKQVSEARKIEDTVNNAVSALGADVKADYDAFTNEGKTLEQIANENKKSVNSVRVNIVKSETAIKKALSKAKLKPLDAKAENPVVDWTTKSARKYFTKEGQLPGGTFQKWVKRNARISKEAEQVKQSIEKLYSSLRKIYKINKIQFILKGLSSVPPDMVEKLNEALAGNIDINTMPKELRKPITKMREHIDALSSELIATGQLPDYLETKTLNNLGVYLTRSYKIFSDPKWIQKIPAEKMTNARNFLYQQGAKNDPNFTLEDADRQLMQMLNDWAGEVESKEKRRGGKLGAKDLSVMMTRSDIPKELRDVMGENNNIIFNYANTISKISRFIADQNFLDAVKQEGAGDFLYTKDAAPSGFNTLIAAEESRTMSPLNGLRTTPEIAAAFEEFGKSYDATQNPFLYGLAWLNAVGKANLTVGSILTQMRNIIGQPFFFVANGHTNLKVIGEEVERLMKDKGLTKEEARQELIKMAAGEGLVGENAYAGELKEAFEQVGLKTFEDMNADEFARQFVALRLFKSGIKGAQRIYQKTDEFGKVIGWLNETDRVMRMNKGMSREEAMSIASERVRNTYPTYSQGSQALRLFRRQPFIGPFATFFYETFRTTYWNTRYAFEDINKGGQARKEGIARLAGTMIQLSVGSFIANALSKAIAGIGGEEEEDVRRMLPPWEKDASMIWFPKDKQGVYNYINLSNLSPYNALTDPFVAMMSGFARGEDPVTIFTEAAGSFLEPFVSEQPVTAAIMDVSRNRTETGKKIYNEEADLSTKTTDILLHVFGKTFTPGTIDRVRKRIVPAIYGETVGTRAPEPLKEIASELTGIRFQNLDMKQAFQNRAWEFNKSQNESERIFRDVATRRRRVTAEEQIEAYRTAEQSRFENWQEMYRDYMAVRRAGATEDEAIDLMTDIKISKREAYMIADGEYMPYEVSNEVLRRSELNGNEVPLDEIEAIADSMPTTLQDLPKKP